MTQRRLTEAHLPPLDAYDALRFVGLPAAHHRRRLARARSGDERAPHRPIRVLLRHRPAIARRLRRTSVLIADPRSVMRGRTRPLPIKHLVRSYISEPERQHAEASRASSLLSSDRRCRRAMSGRRARCLPREHNAPGVATPGLRPRVRGPPSRRSSATRCPRPCRGRGTRQHGAHAGT